MAQGYRATLRGSFCATSGPLGAIGGAAVAPSSAYTRTPWGETMGHVAAPAAVRFEHRTDEDPVLGIGTAPPRLSWIVPAADAGFVQEAHGVEIRCARGVGAGARGA